VQEDAISHHSLEAQIMFTQEDRNYVKALLIDRQARLTKALHSVAPHSVSLSDCDEVQDELDQVTAVLGKIRKVEK
jgi:SepF-like predicted cell division protein (DUF552 family)